MLNSLKIMVFLITISASFVITNTASPQSISNEEKVEALNSIAGLIRERYFHVDIAAEVATLVEGLEQNTKVMEQNLASDFADAITESIRPYDRHFNVTWRPQPSAEATTNAERSVQLARMPREDWARRNNYHFKLVNRLPGNIGYLRLDGFEPFDRDEEPSPAPRQTAEAAMAFLANTDAVIIDLRKNRGGAPSMVHLIVSYFLGEEPVLLNKFYRRDNDQTDEFFTFSKLTGERMPEVPLFVLTSRSTVSAAEEFAYDLQSLDRAIIVGETTAGGANPGRIFPATNGFAVFVSMATAINPVTGTNWEHVGVQPDIEVPGDQALDAAHLLALEAVIKKGDLQEAEAREAHWTQEWLRAKADPLALTETSAADFVGSYGTRKIEFKDGVLTYGRSEGPQNAMIQLSANEFGLLDNQAVRIRFLRDENAVVTRMVVMADIGLASTFTKKLF